MRIAPFVALLFAFGCVSAYDETYAKETEMLEQAEQKRQAEEAAAHAEARKYAAVVYFDVNSAEINDVRELDWFVKQMQPYPQAIIQVQGFADSTGTETLNQELSEQRAASVERYGGTVAQFAGDSILAIFGAPVAHEDDPYRAVRAGLDIVGRVGRSAGSSSDV